MAVLARAGWWVCGATVVVLLVYALMHRAFGSGSKASGAEAVMNLMAGVYGLLLAFLVNGAAARVAGLRDALRGEADTVNRIHLIAQRLPAQLDSAIEESLRTYVRAEFAARAGNPNARTSDDLLNRIWMSFVVFEPTRAREGSLQTQALAELRELRAQRTVIVQAASPAYNEFIWAVLIVGTVSVIAVCIVATLDDPHAPVVLVAMTAVITTALYVLYFLSKPFTDPDFRASVLSRIH